MLLKRANIGTSLMQVQMSVFIYHHLNLLSDVKVLIATKQAQGSHQEYLSSQQDSRTKTSKDINLT